MMSLFIYRIRALRYISRKRALGANLVFLGGMYGQFQKMEKTVVCHLQLFRATSGNMKERQAE
jgi:hypothetical protein